MRFDNVSVYLLFILWAQSAADLLVQNSPSRLKGEASDTLNNYIPGDGQKKDLGSQKRDRRKLVFENAERREDAHNKFQREDNPADNQGLGQQKANGGLNPRAPVKDTIFPTKVVARENVRKKAKGTLSNGVGHGLINGAKPDSFQPHVPKVEVNIKQSYFGGDAQTRSQPGVRQDTQDINETHQDARKGAHQNARPDRQQDIPIDTKYDAPRDTRKDHKKQGAGGSPRQADKASLDNIPSANAGNEDKGNDEGHGEEKQTPAPVQQDDLRRRQNENGRRQADAEQFQKQQYRNDQGRQLRRRQEELRRQELDKERLEEEQKRQEEYVKKRQYEQQRLRELNEKPERSQPSEQPQSAGERREDESLQRGKNDIGEVGGQGKVLGHSEDRHQERLKEPETPTPAVQRLGPNLQSQGADKPQPDKQENAQPGSIGRADVKWDGDDFALVFGDSVYMEQKIRRASVPTSGAPWPKPQYMKERKTRAYRIPSTFQFKISEKTCDIIEAAVKRYRKIILKYSLRDMHDNLEFAKGSDFQPEHLKYVGPPFSNASVLQALTVRIRTPCAKLYPSEAMDESYTLVVKKSRMYIASNEVWGALKGLETFSQLVVKGTDDRLYIREVLVNDYPRFAHRGVLIDTSRHFIFKEVLYDVLEGMAQNKLNVMHWHIVDDQSFPFESETFPKLSEKGSFHSDMVYSKRDVADVIEYARYRGIRVVPEFDTPGHTYSWGLGYPDLLTQCYSGPYPVNGYLGPINPASNYTYDFLKRFFKEVLTVFKDKYVHLGGDEVPLSCWVSNPSILSFSEKIGAYGDTRKLMEYYETKLLKIIEGLAAKNRSGVRTVVWQDVIDTVDQLPERVVIHVWKGGMSDVQRATSMGHHVLYSTCWYLDLIEYGSRWYKYYLCDPTDSSSGYIDERLVLGGEAALWAEYIDNENLMTTLWPRASATAERLWSHKDQRDVQEAGRRLIEHRCRMLGRGLAVAQISGPDYCPSRGPRQPISAGRLMDQEDEAPVDSVPESPKKKLVEDSMIELGRFDLRIGGAAAGSGAKGSDCSGWSAGSSVVPQGNGWVLLVLTLIILAAVIFQVRSNTNGYSTHRILKNKTILFSFVTLLVIYITCYTTIWLQVLDVKRSFLRVQDFPVEPNNRNAYRS